MKAVLLSIRPEWCKKILDGEKTVEVRRTCPVHGTPFKVYIYCTLAGSDSLFMDVLNRDVAAWNRGGWPEKRGRVIGEFTCDRITPLFNVCTDNWHHLAGDVHEWHKELIKRACLTDAELKAYAKGQNCFAWHISDLKIYDTPKPLSAFKGLCKIDVGCGECPYYNYTKMDCDGRTIKRPPQSWCYVEELK